MTFSVKRILLSGCFGALTWFVLMVVFSALFSSSLLLQHGMLSWGILSGIIFFTLPSSFDAPRNGSNQNGNRHAHSSKNDEPLTVTQEGEWAVIHALPVSLGGHAVLAWVLGAFLGGMAGAAVASFLHMMSGGNAPIAFVVVFVALTCLIAKGYVAHINRYRKVQAAPFAVSAEGVRLPNGKMVARANIYAWTVRNARNGQIFISTNHYALAGQMMAQSLVAKSYVLELEHDGKATVVAGGLSSALAEAARDEAKTRGDDLAEQLREEQRRRLKDWEKSEIEESDRRIAASGEKASATLHRLADEAQIGAERWSNLKRNLQGEVMEAIVVDRTGQGLVIYNDGKERWTGNFKGAQLFRVDRGIKVQVDDPAYRAQHLTERRFQLGLHQTSDEWAEWVDRIRMLSVA